MISSTIGPLTSRFTEGLATAEAYSSRLRVGRSPPRHRVYPRQLSEKLRRGVPARDTLIATCRRADGYAQQSSLPAVRSCVGDIDNANGNLTCNYARLPASPQPYYARAPGYAQEWQGPRAHRGRVRDR